MPLLLYIGSQNGPEHRPTPQHWLYEITPYASKYCSVAGLFTDQ